MDKYYSRNSFYRFLSRSVHFFISKDMGNNPCAYTSNYGSETIFTFQYAN